VAQSQPDSDPNLDRSGPEVSSGDAETDRILDSLRSKGYRVGCVQVVFGVGDVRGHIRYVVNGTPLDRAQLRGLDRGWLRLPDTARDESRRPAASPPQTRLT
jgi:hypothetical protein